MRTVDPTSLWPSSSCAIVARSSSTAPEFLVAENYGNALVAARWRRRSVLLDIPETLADHVLSYCAAGSATCSIIIGGVRRDHVQQAGVVTFLPADQPVQWALHSPSDVVHVHLYVSKQALTAFAQQHGDQGVQLLSLIAIRDAWIENYFRLLLNEYELYGRCGRLGDSLFLDQSECLLFGRLLLTQAATNRSASSASAVRARVSPLRTMIVGRLNDYILHNLGRQIRLPQMAEMASLSVDHFVRAFRQATGTTPHRYVLQLRLNHACDLLRDESTPIAGIARECGFSSAAQFSAAFHHRYGLSPSQYRKRH